MPLLYQDASPRTGGEADQKVQQLLTEVEDLKRELGNAQRKLEAKNAEVEDLKEKAQHNAEVGILKFIWRAPVISSLKVTRKVKFETS